MTAEVSTIPHQMECEKVAKPLRIAIVYGRTPMPMRRADQMTVSHLLAFLKARGHRCDLFYIDTGGQVSPENRNWLASVCENLYVYSHNKLSVFCGLLRVLYKLVPVQVGLFSHPRQTTDVRAAVEAGRYDLVYTYYFRSAEVTRDLGRAHDAPVGGADVRCPTLLAMQLSQTLNAGRIARNAPNLLLRWFYGFESRLVERYEALIWRHFTKVALIGHSDVEAVKAACRKWGMPMISNYIFSAHGTNVHRFKPQGDVEEISDHLVFSGVMRTPTNVQAVQWFARNVWPLVKAARPHATWSIVGREPAPEVRDLGKLDGVTITGTVEDPAALMRLAAVCINPMQAGGGMQNKLIEYMASEKAIVATSVANEGILAPPNCLVVADSPEDFAKAVIVLLEDRGRARELGRRARAHVLANWTWEAHFLKLEDEMARLVGRTLN